MERLLIFTRYPEAGKTKTRLIPALGAEGAAQLQRKMTEHTLKQAQKLLKIRSLSLEIYFSGGDETLMQSWLGPEWVYVPQATGDLGERIQTAFKQGFAEGMERIVIVGVDCPDLNCDRLSEAFETLQNNDLVLGEAEDGGYYLVGLSRYLPQLFQDINWGTSQVLQQTLKIAESLGCAIAKLPILGDIDYPEDLPIWEKAIMSYEL
ncbi:MULTISPECIES: TIGR04282 family arsenosugar biosynthesis glycosyltransferase [Spirulina sp. CCY15215]|uniref:TIGR04282 family arsenosugar biosynthesis glycosyltransferase n=1 Tax=Spirulina sp. CCY15215 TaxID=2767591 RepID=UPI00194F8085